MSYESNRIKYEINIIVKVHVCSWKKIQTVGKVFSNVLILFDEKIQKNW